ncbi:hypothetical protein SEUCBS139899_004351 [Sporothrix eucalyptigena]|uniref:Uncharacterized protein n=1 Tax=Sporothrix eucalyptigena TaxID=1812306 RepID=A0ABP0CS61_9PEZI
MCYMQATVNFYNGCGCMSTNMHTVYYVDGERLGRDCGKLSSSPNSMEQVKHSGKCSKCT